MEHGTNLPVRSQSRRNVVCCRSMHTARFALLAFLFPASAFAAQPLRITQLVPGYRYSFARISDGTVRVWGGHSDAAAKMKRFTFPTPIVGWKDVARLDPSGLCAIDREGAIECMDGSPPLPQQVLATETRCAMRKSDPDCGRKKGKFGVGATHFFRGGICATHKDGTVSCLDDALSPNVRVLPEGVVSLQEPCELRLGGEVRCVGKPVIDFVSGQRLIADAHACGIRTNGTVACWQAQGQYGSTKGLNQAHDIAIVADAVRIGMSQKQGCALNKDGELYCWTQRGYYDGHPTAYDKPVKILADVEEFAMGALFGCARNKTSEIYCWGMNDKGQLGQGDRTPRAKATLVAVTNASHLAVGPEEACVLTNDEKVFCWGYNLYGAIGAHGGGVGLVVESPHQLEVAP